MATSCARSIHDSTGMSTISSATPAMTMNGAGERPKMVNGAVGSGSATPQAEMRDRPNITANRPIEARAAPTRSNFLDARGWEAGSARLAATSAPK